MHQDAPIRNVIKLVAYPLPPDLSGSLVPAKVVLKQPAQFASALAHEVRNPLSNINLAVEILQSTMSDDEQKDYLDIILRGTAKINDLVGDLIAYYQTEELRPQRYSINKLLDEVLAKTVDKIMLKHIVVVKDYTSFDNKICVDSQKIKIALTNIIINAIDAMPSENGELKLITKSRKGKCTIEIEDNGIGISKENLKIFLSLTIQISQVEWVLDYRPQLTSLFRIMRLSMYNHRKALGQVSFFHSIRCYN